MNLRNSIAVCLLAAGITGGQAELILSDSGNVTGGNSPGTGFGFDGPGAGVNYQITNRLSGSAAAGLDYFATLEDKAVSSYAISSNRIRVAVAPNSGRFTFTGDHIDPFDFRSVLGSDIASPAAPSEYELGLKIANASSGTSRTSFGISTVDGGIQDWDLGLQVVNNGSDLNIYRRVDSASNGSGADYNNVIVTLGGQAKQEVDLKIKITDAGAQSSGFGSRYEVLVNDTSVFTSATNDFRFHGSAARLILFDIAGGSGPVTYDAFSLHRVVVTNSPPTNNLPLEIVSHRLTPGGLEFTWSSQPGTNYSVLHSTNLTSHFWKLTTNLTASGPNTAMTAATNQAMAMYFRVAQLAQSGLALTHVSAAKRAGTSLVDIQYDLADAYEGHAAISVLVSTNGGQSYFAPAASFSGDVGDGVLPGRRQIVWNAGMDWAQLAAANARIQVVADRSPVSANMALIPSGAFNMGDAKAEGLASETPVHAVNLGAFYLERFEVTKALWDEVRAWATNHDYSFANNGVAAAPNHPVQQISWYDAVKWCNARSEKEGFAPAYFSDAAWTTVYRSGEVNLAAANVRWSGAGYRLPTEAEWEKAARGGLAAQRFPWGDTLAQSQANYWSTTFESFDVTGAAGPHPLASQFPHVVPVGSFRPSGYGLYDVAGNIWEWCWDYYGDAWYADGRAANDNPRGPTSASWGGDRVYRGGSGVDIAWKSRVANRADAPPHFAMGHFGFRVALPAGENLVSAESPIFTLTP